MTESPATTPAISHGSKQVALRQMYMNDLPTVLKIIDAHDDDDAESAEEDYHSAGFDGQFVLEENEKVIGVTGYRGIEATDNTYWLSWTYLDSAHRGRGKGKQMLQALIQKLKDLDARKIFVKVSNYQDPKLGKIYERALLTYQSLGFETELVGKNFYDAGEDQFILGLLLSSATLESSSDGSADDTVDATFEGDSNEAVEIVAEKPIIRFDGLYEIAETEGSYSFSWTVHAAKKLFAKRNFSEEDLNIGLRSVHQDGGKRVFLTFPSNLPLIHQPLQAAGFKYVGQLADYYECGVHELHFSHDLS